MSHCGRHMSPLLLRATVEKAICVISHGAVSTKGHNSDLPISLTSLAESGTSLHKYLLTSSALKRWHPWIDLTNICYFCGRHSLLFFMHLRKMETHLPISRTPLAELRRSHVKKFHTNIYLVQHHGESSPAMVQRSCWLASYRHRT
jgi:hypothetical protein